jgi:tRNA A-37 threonylcarbamoyl transferase component Bud32
VFPDFIQFTRGHASIWIDQRLADGAFIDRLADADQFFREPSCQVIKDQRKIKVGRLTLEIAGAPHCIYIKRYNAFSLRYRLASPFIRSGAFRALQGAAILRAANIPTAIPIAAVETRVRRTIAKSFFITEAIAHGKTVDDYWREELGGLSGAEGFQLRRAFLKSLAQLFHNLHRQGIYHNDLKDANILAVRKASKGAVGFFLLDLEGVKRYAPLSEKRRIKNLVQLHRTLGRTLRRTDKLIFLQHYLGAAFADRETHRRLIARLLRSSRRLDAVKARPAGARVVGKKASHG